jgi:asparagine synthase (glutamine-hydrolysing)
MCGIVGFFKPGGFKLADAELTLVRMRDSIAHRGPDNHGAWLDGIAGIALGHRRLSILDISSAGHQPMISLSDRFVIVFNGEIYNHLELRRRMEGAGRKFWQGRSDTETLLAAIDMWGMEEAVKSCVGMFAFALWDRLKQTITFARDRIGEKPIYYGWQGGTLLFGSELKSLRLHPDFRENVDRDAIALYLRLGYVPAPLSAWQGIRKLLPGSYVTFGKDQKEHLPPPTQYWSFKKIASDESYEMFCGSDQEAIDQLEKHLRKAIEGQSLADVPVGAFLSGGIDSSTVAAIMQSRSTVPIKTFTIGFAEDEYSEAKYAKQIANHLGTDHTELYVTSQLARDLIPQLPGIYDEPFGDSSAIPTYLVAKLARDSVKVVLSGDGGDELFGGYSRYHNQSMLTASRMLFRTPKILRHGLASSIRMAVDTIGTNNIAGTTLSFCMPSKIISKISSSGEKYAEILESDSFAGFYSSVIGHWISPSGQSMRRTNLRYGFQDLESIKFRNEIENMMAVDTLSYLPDDILVKVDRAAMFASLETRIPLLDHRLVEFVWKLQHNLKVRNKSGKWILKQVLYRHVPKNLIDREKKGFSVPIDLWLRGPLRDWAEHLLDENRIKNDGFLSPRQVRERWQQHLDGRRNWRDAIWLVLMLQAWKEANFV